MTYPGHMKNGQVMLDELARLPEGATVSVEVVKGSGDKPAVWDELLKLAGTVEALPPDMARNHDHYLYGTPESR